MTPMYNLTTVPPVRDVLDYPLSLFTRSVLSGNKVLMHISQDNCKSYIAAIAKEAERCAEPSFGKFSWSEKNLEHIHRITASLCQIIEAEGITLDDVSVRLLNICFFLKEPGSQLQFGSAFQEFAATSK